MEEIGMYEELDGIEITTAVRHGWRKHAKDTSVVAIGEKTHTVLQCQHLTKTDDAVSQRHEMKGTGEIYRYFETKNTAVKEHTHDRNMAVNKLVKTSGYTLMAWCKMDEKSLKSISTGPRYKEGSTWSE